MSSGKAKTIRIHLPDGNPNSICIADIVMSRMQAVSFHRDMLQEIRKNEEIHDIDKPGIYIIIGSRRPGDIHDVAYIGQSSNVGGGRLQEHRRKKSKNDEDLEFWENTIVLTTNDESMSTGNMNHIEAELIRKAKENLRWKITNKQNPKYHSESLAAIDRDFTDKFVDLATTLVGILGCDLFRTFSDSEKAEQSTQEDVAKKRSSKHTAKGKVKDPSEARFVCTSGGKVNGKMVLDSERGFIVLKDSTAPTDMTAGSSDNLIKLHEALVTDGVLVKSGKLLIFTRNYVFSSVSAAASIVKGCNCNGRTEWKLDNDRKTSYDQWREKLDEMNHPESSE